MAGHGPIILRLPRYFQPLGQRIRGRCHIRIAVRPRRKSGLIIAHGRPAIRIGAQAVRTARITFHAPRDHHLCGPAFHQSPRQQHRIQPARALPVNCQPRHMAQPRRQRQPPCRIATRPQRVGADHVIYRIGRNARIGQQGRNHRCGQCLNRQPGKRPATRDHRRSFGRDDARAHGPTSRARR